MSSQVVEAEVVSRNELEKQENSWLSEPERYALSYFRLNYQKGGSATFSIAPSEQAKLFGLYLNGKSLGEIRRLTHPSFSLGQIVDAAVTGDWESEKRDYQSGLFQKTRERLQQIGCESLDFLADSLAAAHKQHGDNLKRFLISGNPNDLGAFGIDSVRKYKEVAELMLKMSGQDKASTLTVKGEVLHTPTVSPPLPNSAGGLGLLAKAKKTKELEDAKRQGKSED